MCAPSLSRWTSGGVTLLGDAHCPGGVTLAFTERAGGASTGAYSSLNLGDACGDDEELVRENRRRALSALRLGERMPHLVNPVQVHGSEIVTIAEGWESPEEGIVHARQGADAVVCALPGVPVLLCSADCVLVVLVATGGIRPACAVVHSGWRGTKERIVASALARLCEVAGCGAWDVLTYIGPHIGVADYEVSPELAADFSRAFGEGVISGERNLDLGAAIRVTLSECGVIPAHIAEVTESTASNTERFFSYRTAGGTCGRIGALACITGPDR